MLRASSEKHAQSVELEAVMSGDVASGVAFGVELIEFAEAVVSRDAAAISSARAALAEAAGHDAMVDAAGVVSNFQRMVRIADATGIGLGNFEESTREVRESLGINAFHERKTAVLRAPTVNESLHAMLGKALYDKGVKFAGSG